MKKEELIELTNKLYKMTLLFPKKEPLRYKIREAADEILANFVSSKKDLIFAIERNLEVLNAYFEIAKWQNWANYFDVLELQEKYDKIKDNLEKEDLTEEKSLKIEFPPTAQTNKVSDRGPSSTNLDSRKEKILKILEEKGRVQVWQVKEVLQEVSKRTLRRDFEKLLKQGLIERIGEKNETFYQLNFKQ